MFRSLPQALLCLLLSTIVQAQTRQELAVDSNNAFTPSNLPNPPVFSIPGAENLTISVALCSTGGSAPRFFVTNSSQSATPGSSLGPDVFEIRLNNGYGSWTGEFFDGGALAVENAGQFSFELGVSGNGAMHQVIPTATFLGDTTSNQAIIYSLPFSTPVVERPTYPEYILPEANVTAPAPPNAPPDFSLIVAPTSAQPPLTSLSQTGCVLSSQKSAGTISNQTLWLRDEQGWRMRWLVEGLTPATNYTAYIVQDKTNITGPIYFATKSASFECPLVYDLPYCPGVAYPVPLPAPSGTTTYTSSNLPSEVSGPLLSYLTNFTVSLTSFACGRDLYSPIVGCDDCQREYRKWLCAITFTRCGEPSPSNPDSYRSVAPAPDATGISALTPQDPKAKPKKTDPNAPQKVFSALVPQATTGEPRSPTLPSFGKPYLALLPCIEVCTGVDRACPNMLGFTCPTVDFNAGASYGMGYIDGPDGTQWEGATGNAQDQWGNIWCNGG